MQARAALAALLSAPSAAWAQVPLGPPFQVNTYTLGTQNVPRVASDAAGEFVVVWQSAGLDGDSYGVLARRYDASGGPLGAAEFRVNAYTTGFQIAPSVASDPDGNLVVLWNSLGQDGNNGGVFGRRFDSSGAVLGGEFRANTYTLDHQLGGRVGLAADGRFVTVWTDYLQDGGGRGVFGQRFDAAGAVMGPEFQVNTHTTLNQFYPRVSVAADGRFVVTWVSALQDGSANGIFLRRYDAAGAPEGPEVQVNTYTSGVQNVPAMAGRADGSFVVAWSTYGQDGSVYGVAGRRFDAAGAPLGAEFQVNQYTTGHQYFPDVAMDADGNFIVVWLDNGRDGSGRGIFGRWYDSTGAALSDDFPINAYTTGTQTTPAVAPLSNGRFVVVWTDGGQDGSGPGLFGQRLAPDIIFRDAFESGSLSAWSSASTDGGDLNVSTEAALNFSVAGLRAVVDDTAGLFVQDDRPLDEDRYRARFYFDPNTFDPGETQAHRRTRIFIAFEEAPTRRVAAVVLRRLSGIYALMLRCRLDDNSQDDSGFFTVSDAPHLIELDWSRSRGPDALSGSCRLSIDGVEVSARTDLDNSVSSVDFVRLGALSVKTGAAGAMYWDEFVSRRLDPAQP